MWTGDHRRAADRRGLRYPSDLTDAEWELVRPFIRPAKRGGRPRSVDIREVLNAIFYVLSTGCQWNTIPFDLPPQHRLGLPRFFGSGTAPSPVFTTRSTSRAASAPGATPVRHLLRSAKARTVTDLWATIARLSHASPECRNYLVASGYDAYDPEQTGNRLRQQLVDDETGQREWRTSRSVSSSSATSPRRTYTSVIAC